jgi:alkylation response protein AidB-like acyl-CoA dehydrogenase
MVSGAGSGGVDRIGGRGVDHVIDLARQRGRIGDPLVRQAIMQVFTEEKIRGWTNQRVRAGLQAGRSPGPESSIGKVHAAELNQRIQMLAVDIVGMDAAGWPSEASARLPHSMLRSRANTIEGGTSEVNRNVIAERVLGLPREPDPYRDATWRETPRNG